MASFNTGYVDVFPSTLRKEVPYGKFTSEQNFVNILNSITDKHNYVLSYGPEVGPDGESHPTLRVVIHGYLFVVRDFTFGATDNRWLLIKVENGGENLVNFNDTSSTELDVNNEFKGLEYTTTDPTTELNADYTTYTLQVVAAGQIVNKIRLSTDSIYYEGTEGNLTAKIDSKQNNLIADDPIILNGNNIYIKSTEVAKLNGLNEKGSNVNPVFFSGSGIATPLDASVGIAGSGQTQSGTWYNYTRDIHLVTGNIEDNRTMYYSTDVPDSNLGNIGDFWFKYNNN